MFEELKPGLSAEVRLTVADRHTARHLGTGNVYVLATPVMIGLMEGACIKAVDPRLPHGQQTVGVRVDVRHLAATPLGMQVVARGELVNIEGRKLTFKVEASDEKEKIGEGVHERFIIDVERFYNRVQNKANQGDK